MQPLKVTIVTQLYQIFLANFLPVENLSFRESSYSTISGKPLGVLQINDMLSR